MPFVWWNRRRPRPSPSSPCRAGRRYRPRIEPLEDRSLPTALLGLSTGSQLVAFDSNSPATISGKVAITGLQNGESIVGIEFRPKTGQLYGLGSSSRLYVISPTTGAATPVGTATFAVPLSGTAFGFAFDPVADRVRAVSETGQNMRIDPDTGAVIDGDPNTPGTQPDTSLNPPSHVVEIAYSNDSAGATSTTLYGIDSASDMFVQIGGSDGNPSPNLGAVSPLVTVGADTSDQVGLDINPGDNTGYAAITVNGAPQLLGVSLTSGPWLIGAIGDGSIDFRGLAVIPPSAPSPPPAPPPAPTPPPPSPTAPPPAPTPPPPSAGAGVSLVAVTNVNELLRFNSATPGTIAGTAPITGLQGGETILGIAFRPTTGQLYGLGSTGRLYVINPASGAAAQIGTGRFDVPLIGAAFGFSFDPVNDQVRVVSDADLNLRINPDTGAVIDGDPGSPGTQPDAFLNSTYVVGVAYTNEAAGAATTTLFGIDGANGRLVNVGGPDGSPSPNLGQITPVGSLGVNVDWTPVPHAAFDITGTGNTPFAALQVGGTTSLYTLDLASGAATAVGRIGTGNKLVVGLAAGSPGQFSIASTGTTAAENAGAFQITVTRTAGTDGQVTVDYATADGTAQAGHDYVATHGTLVFQPGETSKTVSIPIINDTLVEGPETLTLTLSNPTGGATLGSPSSVPLTINDDDFAPLAPVAPTPAPLPPPPSGLTPNECYVTQLYRDLLGRNPDPVGLVDWTDPLDSGVASRQEVVLGIESSDEFRVRALSLMYTKLLQRPLDQSGGAFWLAALKAGATMEQVVGMILGSQEYYVRRGGGTDAGFLGAVYGDALGRAVDPAGGAFWAQAAQAGATRTQVAQAILASNESHARDVGALYGLLLHRDPDPNGMATFVAAANAGVSMEKILAVIAASPEYVYRACGTVPGAQ